MAPAVSYWQRYGDGCGHCWRNQRYTSGAEELLLLYVVHHESVYAATKALLEPHNWSRPEYSLAIRKAIVRAFSPPSSLAIQTAMKAAANPPIVKFSGGEDGRSGRFRGWTFRVSAGEVLAIGAVNGGSPKVV